MPIYEYVCDACQQRFERYVHAWGEPVACPGCESDSVQKQLSRFAMSSSSAGDPGAGPTTGGCCGGSCGCAH